MAAGVQINKLKSVNTAGMDPGGLKDPTPYKSTVEPVINQLVDRVKNRKAFTYDPDQDAAYQAYEKKYTRLGNNAREDTLADVATNTGGMASSYAVSAAAQAQNDYNQQLTDLIPQLMQAAYERYDADRQYDLNAMSSLQSVDDSRFNQFDANRNYGLNSWKAKQEAWMDALGYNLDLASGIEGRRQFNLGYNLDKLGYNLDKSSLKETKRSNKAREKLDRDQFNWQKAQAQKKTSSGGGSSSGSKGSSGKKKSGKSSGKSGKGSSGGGKSGKASGGSSNASGKATTAGKTTTEKTATKKTKTTVYNSKALLPNGMKPASTSKKKKKADKPKITKTGSSRKVYPNKFQLSSLR